MSTFTVTTVATFRNEKHANEYVLAVLENKDTVLADTGIHIAVQAELDGIEEFLAPEPETFLQAASLEREGKS